MPGSHETQSRIFKFLFQVLLALAVLTSPAKAFYSGIERIGIDPRNFEEGTVLRCYQNDALEAGRPYRSYETETDAALRAVVLASQTASAKFDILNAAKKAAEATFNPVITANPGTVTKAKLEIALSTALIAELKVKLKIDEWKLKSAENSLEIYKGLRSGELIGQAALAGASEGSAEGVLGGPVGIAVGAVEGAAFGAAKGLAFLAAAEALGGLPYFEKGVADAKAAIVARKASIAQEEGYLVAAIQELASLYGVNWFTEPTSAELQAVKNAQDAYDQAHANLLSSYDVYAAVVILDNANTPPPCDSFEAAVLLDNFCTAADQPLVSSTDTALDRALIQAICLVAAESVENIKVHTMQAVGSLVGNRMTHILNNPADLTGFLAGSDIIATGPLGSTLNFVEESSFMSVAFSGSLTMFQAEASRKQKERYSLLLKQPAYGFPAPAQGILTENSLEPATQRQGLSYNPAAGAYPEAAQQQGYDVWTQLYGSRSKAGGSNSSVWVGYLGAHYFVTSETIVGGMIQLDWSDETNSVLGSKADGFGWMIGPYFATKLPGQNLFFDARASWGRSKNSVTPFSTYEDDFNTERWMAGAKLSGLVNSNGFTIRPSVGVSYFEETQGSYIDSNGLAIRKQKFAQGETRVGSTVSYDFELGRGGILRPKIGISGIWNFHMQNGVSSQDVVLRAGNVRARMEAGVAVLSRSGMILDISGSYDGLGISSYSAYGGNIRLSIPLQ